MSFHDLSKESKQIARETLAEMLKLERSQAFNLNDGVSIDLAKFVKDAFIELETEVTSQLGQFSQQQNQSAANPPSGICISNGGIGNS